MPLPQYGGPQDILDFVRYLKPKPTGATLAEARKVLGSSSVDGRKISALQFWNILEVDQENENNLLLSSLGREVARDESKLAEVLQQVVAGTPAYRGALEWAHHQGFDQLDTHELGPYWHQHHRSELDSDADASIRRACAAFFRIAAEARLGTYKVGRGGNPTRLELERDALKSFVEHGPDIPPWSAKSPPPPPAGKGEPADDAEEDTGTEPESPEDQSIPEPPEPPRTLRVFISHGKNKDLVDQVATVLDLADIAYEVAVEEESTAIPVPEKVLSSMRRCSAGIIIVSADEDEEKEQLSVNENVLIETGAAFVLYDRQVILVWDKRIPIPSNLQGLYRCEFEGDELGWSAGMKLMKAIKEFRTS